MKLAIHGARIENDEQGRWEIHWWDFADMGPTDPRRHKKLACQVADNILSGNLDGTAFSAIVTHTSRDTYPVELSWKKE